MIRARPSDIYRHRVQSGQLSNDPRQVALFESIDKFYCSVQRSLRADERSFVQTLFDWGSRCALLPRRRAQASSPAPNDAGLYLHGGVGRGKSQLMHILRQSLPASHTAYYHFHELMNQVHRQLDELGDERDPLPTVVQRLTENCRVLFVDEFFVVDIADAMLMSGFLSALFDHGVSLVTTSNFAPEDLYRGGLQRARFLPTIALIRERMVVLDFGAGLDYRRLKLARQPIFICNGNGGGALADIYTDLTELAPHAGTVRLAGRSFKVAAVSPDLVWFHFRVLCGSGRSRLDYRELAQTYPMIIIDGLYAMDDSDNDIVRRFIHLIDILYENRVKILLSSRVALAQLYSGQRLREEFKRTHSRIVEMCSPDWLALPHLCAPAPASDESAAPAPVDAGGNAAPAPADAGGNAERASVDAGGNAAPAPVDAGGNAERTSVGTDNPDGSVHALTQGGHGHHSRVS